MSFYFPCQKILCKKRFKMFIKNNRMTKYSKNNSFFNDVQITSSQQLHYGHVDFLHSSIKKLKQNKS